MEITYWIAFNYSKYLRNDGTGKVDVIVYSSSNKKKKRVNTGVYVLPKFWDENKKEVKKTHPEHVKLNRMIAKVVQEISNTQIQKMIDGKKFSMNDLDTVVESKEECTSFTKFYADQIENNTRVSERTRESEKNTFSHFKAFTGDVAFKEVNHDLIVRFDNYIRSDATNIKSEFTIYDQHKILKKYINQAIIRKYIDVNDYAYRRFNLSMPKSDRKNISREQLELLEKMNTGSDKRLEITKDLFLFSCYTGVRWGDAMHLDKSNLIKHKEDFKLKFTARKNGLVVVLPLSKLFDGKAVDIIEKYKKEDSERLLPRISNEAINLKLKLIGDRIGMKEYLTFHYSRHTFGTILADVKPDPYLIKQLMGHSDIKTSMLYIHTSSKAIEDKLSDIDWG